MGNIDELLGNLGKMLARKNSPEVVAYEQFITNTKEKFPVGTVVQSDFFIKAWEGATATISPKNNVQMVTFVDVNDIEDVVSGKKKISKNY